ncbi:MAG: hypothetical protein HKN33_00310 [Pyrinomonadaceae bacterium]|nr:hypothetical protein [Pyrinomonadaceae bacterium]
MEGSQVEFKKGAVKPIDCLSEAWNLVMANIGLYLGVAVVAFIILGLLFVINWFLYGPVMVGLVSMFLMQKRGENPSFGQMFSGFSKFLPAMIVGLAFMIPTIIQQTYRFSFTAAEFLTIYNPNELTAGTLIALRLLGFAVSMFVLLGVVIMSISLNFSFPLFAEKDLGLMETVKLSARAGWANAGMLFLLLLLKGVIIIAGVLACCVGLLLALPLVWAMDACAYRMVFPDENAPGDMAPPQPEQYGFQQ